MKENKRAGREEGCDFGEGCACNRWVVDSEAEMVNEDEWKRM